MTKALNVYRYKTFVLFKSVTFENFQIFLQINSGIKINTLESDKNCVTFENFLIFMENAIGITPNTSHDFQKNFKSGTFENYKSFPPVEEVQSQIVKICRFSANASVIITLTMFADHTIYILKIIILRTTQTSSTPLQFLKKTASNHQ